MNNIVETLLDYSARALSKQDKEGAFPAGRNGAYGDIDTPLRTTAHWTFTFSQAFQWTQDQRFRRAAESGASYVANCIAMCKGGAVMRVAKGKDYTNGVLGPAHLLEALVEAGAIEGLERFSSVAEEFYERHSFNQSLGCWNRLRPDGENEAPDNTFNHQLYFAAVASHLKSPRASLDVSAFCSSMDRSLGVHPSGLIRHELQTSLRPPSWRWRLRRRIVDVFRDDVRRIEIQALSREWSYHCYNLHAFSLLALKVPLFARSIPEKWGRIVLFTDGNDFALWRRNAEKSTMPLVSGQETLACDYAFYRIVLCGDQIQCFEEDVCAELSRNQSPNGSATLFSADPETQRARIYRYWRLVDSPASRKEALRA
jgi:hypothetical protein